MQQGCRNFQQLCLRQDSTVAQCKHHKGLKYLIPTAAARQLSQSMCGNNPRDEGCSRCTWNGPTPTCNVLSLYGSLCFSSPGAAECGVWLKMCDKDSSLYVCRQQLPGGRPGPPGHAAAHSAGRTGWSDGSVSSNNPQPPAPQQWATSTAGGVKVLCWLWSAASLLATLVAVA